jgi:hypothetical protein
MRLFSRFILCLTAFTVSTQAAPVIWTPRPHNPAFVQPGDSFVAEVRDSSSRTPQSWTAQLSNDLRTWPCTVNSAVYSTIHHNTESGWRLTISVPADTPPELLDLTVAHPLSGTYVALRAVSVVNDFETSFYILHTTDQHVDNTTAVKANGSSSLTWATGSTQSMGWAAPVINLINPRFVVYTGDNLHLYFSATDWCGMTEAQHRCSIYLDALKQYKVPTLMTTGNHDIGWSDYVSIQQWRDTYETLIGQRSFSFYMGSFYVLTNEWTSDEFLSWAKSDYTASWSNPAVKYRLIAQHYYDSATGWTTVPDASHPCSLAIVGHNHTVNTLQTSPYLVYSDGTGQDYQQSGFYDFRRSPTGWTCMQASSHVSDVDVFKLFGDWGTPGKVRSSFTCANDGTQTSNMSTIINDLPQNFYNGRVKFLMKHGNYRVAGGSIEAQYDYANGTKTAVLVKVNIIENTTTSVSITKFTNFADLAQFSGWWIVDNCGSQNNCQSNDMNTDGIVDFEDFALFASQWL